MDLKDFFIPAPKIKTERWQLGYHISDEIAEQGIALVFVSDCRGAGVDSGMADFRPLRKMLYRLSNLDFDVPVCDLGDLITGKTQEDTAYILQEVMLFCLQKKVIPIIIGGSPDLSFAMILALNVCQKNINYTQIANTIAVDGCNANSCNEKNFLGRILESPNLSIKNFHLLGYQKHLNDFESVKLIKDVDFDIVRLADMMNDTTKTEPYFRLADLATVNCDAIESFGEPISLNPQVNGLNRREICAYMKEIGLSERLKAIGIFNYNFESGSRLNHQLLAQMIWYSIEGINIRKTHPTERHYETFYVMNAEKTYTFRRDTFTNLWYFGDDDNVDDCIPCSPEDFEQAKKGFLNSRFFKL